jgi:alpha-L-rhamnosidase
MVQTYDVTNLLQPGQTNLLALCWATAGSPAASAGWAWQQYARDRRSSFDFNAQLEITYADGTTDTIATDATWKAGPGQVVGSDEQLGEVQDARKAVPGIQPAFDDSTWAASRSRSTTIIELDPQLGPPVRRLMELTPKKITRIGDMWIVDFGQNMVGHVRLTGTGPAGRQVRFCTAKCSTPTAPSTTKTSARRFPSIRIHLRRNRPIETFEPHFTFHGFRYAQITGYPGELTADNIRGIVVGSDTPDTGSHRHVQCRRQSVDLQHPLGPARQLPLRSDGLPAARRAHGLDGRCPGLRPTAAYNADVSGFFSKWMVDVDDGQTGPTPALLASPPRAWDSQTAGYPIWGDAGVIIPWVMYTTYGDKAFLDKNYDHMAKWVDQLPALPTFSSKRRRG